jgi:phage antirepressor YoqD-like protein
MDKFLTPSNLVVMTMSSVELVGVINELREPGSAELRHDNFMAKIASHPGITSPKFLGHVLIPGPHGAMRKSKCYHLPKREAELMVMSESLAVQTYVYDRMVKLESHKPSAIPQTLAQALRLAADQADRIESQQKALALAEPKAQALDVLVTRTDGAVCITNAAKDLQMPPNSLFKWLQENRWIYRRAGGSGFVAYQPRIQSGCLKHKITEVTRPDGSVKFAEQVLVTAKGLANLAVQFLALNHPHSRTTDLFGRAP